MAPGLVLCRKWRFNPPPSQLTEIPHFILLALYTALYCPVAIISDEIATARFRNSAGLSDKRGVASLERNLPSTAYRHREIGVL
jgi:hypothetical protein